jgi:hypothetical protein
LDACQAARKGRGRGDAKTPSGSSSSTQADRRQPQGLLLVLVLVLLGLLTSSLSRWIMSRRPPSSRNSAFDEGLRKQGQADGQAGRQADKGRLGCSCKARLESCSPLGGNHAQQQQCLVRQCPDRARTPT